MDEIGAAIEECAHAPLLKPTARRSPALRAGIERLHGALFAPEADPRTLAVGYGMLLSCLAIQEQLGDSPAYDRIALTWEACQRLPPEHTRLLRIELASDPQLDLERVLMLLSSLSIVELSLADVESLLATLKVLPQRFACEEPWTTWSVHARARRKELRTPAQRSSPRAPDAPLDDVGRHVQNPRTVSPAANG